MSTSKLQLAYGSIDPWVLDAAGMPSYFGDLNSQQEEFFSRLTDAVLETTSAETTVASMETQAIAAELADDLRDLASHLLAEADSLLRLV